MNNSIKSAHNRLSTNFVNLQSDYTNLLTSLNEVINNHNTQLIIQDIFFQQMKFFVSSIMTSINLIDQSNTNFTNLFNFAKNSNGYPSFYLQLGNDQLTNLKVCYNLLYDILNLFQVKFIKLSQYLTYLTTHYNKYTDKALEHIDSVENIIKMTLNIKINLSVCYKHVQIILNDLYHIKTNYAVEILSTLSNMGSNNKQNDIEFTNIIMDDEPLFPEKIQIDNDDKNNINPSNNNDLLSNNDLSNNTGPSSNTLNTGPSSNTLNNGSSSNTLNTSPSNNTLNISQPKIESWTNPFKINPSSNTLNTSPSSNTLNTSPSSIESLNNPFKIPYKKRKIELSHYSKNDYPNKIPRLTNSETPNSLTTLNTNSLTTLNTRSNSLTINIQQEIVVDMMDNDGVYTIDNVTHYNNEDDIITHELFVSHSDFYKAKQNYDTTSMFKILDNICVNNKTEYWDFLDENLERPVSYNKYKIKHILLVGLIVATKSAVPVNKNDYLNNYLEHLTECIYSPDVNTLKTYMKNFIKNKNWLFNGVSNASIFRKLAKRILGMI